GKVGEVMAVGSELIRLEVEGGSAAESPPAEKHRNADAAPSASTPKAAHQRDSKQQETKQQETKRQDAPVSAGTNAAEQGVNPSPRLSIVPSAHGAGAAVAARPEGGRPLASPAVRRRAW